jgi:hypothetical protein
MPSVLNSIIFTAPAQLNAILLLFNRGETLFSFHWGHAAYVIFVRALTSMIFRKKGGTHEKTTHQL